MVGAESGVDVVGSESRADVAQKDEPADGVAVGTEIDACEADSRSSDGQR